MRCSEASERVHEINDFDRQLTGFAVEPWLAAMRGQILVLLGRLDEARPVLDRLLQAPDDPQDITRHLANAAYVDLVWSEGDAALAEQHAEQIALQAEQSGSPYVAVSARTCRALNQFAEALAFARAGGP